MNAAAVPANRLAALARYGLAARAPALRDLAEPKRRATLVATARHLEAAAVDDAMDLVDVLVATRLISAARRASAAERLAAMPRLERAPATLAGAAKVLLAALDEGGAWLDTGAAWAAVERVAPREDVLGAVAVVEERAITRTWSPLDQVPSRLPRLAAASAMRCSRSSAFCFSASRAARLASSRLTPAILAASSTGMRPLPWQAGHGTCS